MFEEYRQASRMISKYGELGKKTSGFDCSYPHIYQSHEVIAILKEAQGRDIVPDYPSDGRLDGVGYKFEGEIDPSFSLDELLKDIE